MNGGRIILVGLVSVVLLAGIPGYMGWRLIGPFKLRAAARASAWIALVLLVVLNFASRTIGRSVGGPVEFGLTQLAGIGTGFLAFALLLLVARDVAWLLARGGDALLARIFGARLLPAGPGRRQAILRASAIGVLGASLALLGLGYAGARGEPVLERVQIEVPGLARELDGYRIAHVSDVHLGGLTAREDFSALVDRVDALGPDLVAITGDLVEASVRDVGGDVEPLARLRARDGVYYVFGNHEVYAGADEWISKVRELGAVPLVNEHRAVRRGSALLLVAGVPNASEGMHGTAPWAKGIAAIRADPAAALNGSPPADFKLLLAHQPSGTEAAERAGFDLLLAGHTHGGQFFPWTRVASLAYPFVAGLGRLGRMQVYVSRGVGVYVAPVRLGAPPEIAVLELRRAGPDGGPPIAGD